ncbi:MAG: homoserine O-acetyltransferase MetX [Ktedonobacterales bacterium]
MSQSPSGTLGSPGTRELPEEWPLAYFSSAGRTPVRVPIGALSLDEGDTLDSVVLACEAWGALSPARDNVILLCHALTGNSHAHDEERPDDQRAGWWNPLVGPGRAFDTNNYFVLSSNVLGGSGGSTGPTSPHPADGQRYRLRFPKVTVGDMVRAQRVLLQALGIPRLAVVAGGSLGGLQALEWAIAYPELVERAVVVAAATRLSAQGLAIDDIARQTIMGDPAWNSGNYPPSGGPHTGLALARMLAMLTYTSAEGLEARFGRRPATRASSWPLFGPRLEIETYLHHQGEKLTGRFDANTYLYLTNAMDRYDAALGDGRGTDASASARIRAQVLAIGISSDWLYPPRQVRSLAEGIVAAGGRAQYQEIESPHGHDAFLQEWDCMQALLRPFVTAA